MHGFRRHYRYARHIHHFLWTAFVIQFRANGKAFAGRVERVASGETILFWDEMYSSISLTGS
jgi:hypothetical protein